MNDEHKKMIGDPDKEHYVISWIEARCSDFGLNLPALVILEKLKEDSNKGNDGHE